MTEQCSTCGQLSATIQADLFGGPQQCLGCGTKAHIGVMLDILPIEEDDEWEDLTDWEQTFLPSVRDQFARKGTLTDLQYRSLERLYDKHN